MRLLALPRLSRGVAIGRLPRGAHLRRRPCAAVRHLHADQPTTDGLADLSDGQIESQARQTKKKAPASSAADMTDMDNPEYLGQLAATFAPGG